MGLLDTGNYAGERLIADSILLCKITDMRTSAVEGKDGGPPLDVEWMTLSLQEEGKDTDGGVLPVGFPKDVSFRVLSNGATGADDKAIEMSERNKILFWKGIAAAVGLPNNDKLPEAVKERGGKDAVIGRTLRVQFTAKGGYQNVKAFMPATA